MTAAELKRAMESWRQHCREVQAITQVSLKVTKETTQQRDKRIRYLLAHYDAFCEYYFPHYLTVRDKASGQVIRTIHNAPFHTRAANLIRNNANLRAVFQWPRFHAKSTHIGIFIPIWLMVQRLPLIHFMLTVNATEAGAKKLLGDLQAELEFNQRLIADFGEFKNMGSWTEGEFKTRQGIKFLAVGRGQTPRGLRDRENRPDYIHIDDIDEDRRCLNESLIRKDTEWVWSALFGTMDAGRGRFIAVGNLISKCSVLANLAKNKKMHLSVVKAVDKEGNPVWPEKWSREEAREYAETVGYRVWQKEMMHNPVVNGSIFRYDWIRFKKLPKLEKYDMLVCYTDPSFKSTTANDYKACRLWGKIGSELHLIDCYVRQDTVSGMVRWLYDLYESTRDRVAVLFYIEANFMQDIILDEFDTEGKIRGYQLPILPDKRKKPDKIQRIEAVSPLWERGYVFYNEALKDSPDMQVGIDQTLALERGSRAHDDAPDADEGAIWILQNSTRQGAFDLEIIPRPSPRNAW